MKTYLALALALTLSTTVLLAKEVSFTSCTNDQKSVTLVVDVNDDLAAKHPVVLHIAKAFDIAAQSMTAADLIGEPGFVTFASNLDQTDYEAINQLAIPVVTGTCK